MTCSESLVIAFGEGQEDHHGIHKARVSSIVNGDNSQME